MYIIITAALSFLITSSVLTLIGRAAIWFLTRHLEAEMRDIMPPRRRRPF